MVHFRATRVIVIVICLCRCLTGGFAQAPVHSIEVGYIDNFNRGDLVIIDSHYIEYYLYNSKNQLQGDKRSFALTWSPVDIENNQYKPGLLAPGTAIAEINGIPTKSMSIERFYSIMDEKDTFSLGVVEHRTGLVKTVYLEKRSPIQSDVVREWLPTNIQSYPGSRNWDIYPQSYNSFYGGLISVSKKEARQIICDETDMWIEEYVDDSFDFGLCRTYSVEHPDSDDEQIFWYYLPMPDMIRVQGNADLRFSVVNKGAAPYQETQNYATITKYVVSLEIVAKNREDAVVWKMTGTYNTANSTRSSWDYRPLCEWACIPPNDRSVVIRRSYIKRCGIIQDESTPSVIAYVEPGSRAEKAGFQPGDILVKAEAEASYEKADRSWGLRNGHGDGKSIKIKVNTFPYGFFDDTTAQWVQSDEFLPYLDIDGMEYPYALSVWLNSQRFQASVLPWGCAPGQKSAFLDWHVTVKRNNRNVKLILPRALNDGYLVVLTSYIP